jgi:hypothetical protein
MPHPSAGPPRALPVYEHMDRGDAKPHGQTRFLECQLYWEIWDTFVCKAVHVGWGCSSVAEPVLIMC